MAEFRCASIFSDNMVLQRRKPIAVFGEGAEGELITVELNGIKETGLVKNNTWTIFLPEREAESGLTMKVSANKKEIIFRNIAIGEVWLAGGQSNMEWPIENSAESEEIFREEETDRIRAYQVPKHSFMDDEFMEAEKNSVWKSFSAKNSRTWSAVAYFFSRKIIEYENVTVGIIHCNWGGTLANNWISLEEQEKNSDLSIYIREFQEAVKNKTLEEQIKEYNDYTVYAEQFDKRVGEYYAKNPTATWDEVLEACGECRYPGPMNSKNPYRPGGLYECMLKRIIPYSLKGVLYYQGESDDRYPELYFKFLSLLIQNWRDSWKDNTLPFLIVQLPMHKYEADEDFKNWPVIREAQAKAFQTYKNTGLCVIIDQGVFNDIHPKKKKEVGHRLGYNALYHVYHRVTEEKAYGPRPEAIRYEGNRAELLFSNIGQGFLFKEEVKGFEVAGADGEYRPAKAIVRDDRIFLTSDQVDRPENVRYLWTNYMEVDLFSKGGLPVPPFRYEKFKRF